MCRHVCRAGCLLLAMRVYHGAVPPTSSRQLGRRPTQAQARPDAAVQCCPYSLTHPWTPPPPVPPPPVLRTQVWVHG